MVDFYEGKAHNMIMFIKHSLHTLSPNAIVKLIEVLGFDEINIKFNLSVRMGLI